MLRYFFLIFAVIALSRPLEAASSYAGEFLALGAGARSLALGSAYVAVVDDATAGYWNSAALSNLKQRQLHLMHAERFSGLVKNDFFALGLPQKWVDGLSLSLIRVGVDDIEFTELQDPGRPLGPNNRPLVASTANSADYALYLSAGHRLNDRLSLGTSLKLIYRDVASFSGQGIGLDLGLRYHLNSAIVLAANIRDVTTTPIVWDNDTTDRIQPSVLLGVAYTTQIAGGRATAAFASRTGGDATDESGATPLNAGVEYWYGNLALRAGMEDSRQAFGLGLRPHKRITLDIAYLNHDELESTYRFSAGFHF